ncbi:MAG: diphthine synthase [Nanobdellota archaeon]
MVLYMIGLGLWDVKDITLKGLEAVKTCKKVYLENYTSKLSCSIEEMEKLYGKKIILADRKLVEYQGDTIIEEARDQDIAFLVIGDPFCATTHLDLRIRAEKNGVKVKIIHNASIVNAIGITGLDLYRFGKITSIPFENKNLVSPVEVIKKNLDYGLYSLVLFDLDPSSNKYMTISEAVSFLKKAGLEESTFCIGCAGVGSGSPQIMAGSLNVIESKEFSLFPQCLIIPGKMHFMEEEMIEKFRVD